MQPIKPLLWLLEPYIVYKACIWGARFTERPLTWEGDIDWFSFTLAALLLLDAIVLPLVLLYWPPLNPEKPVPQVMYRMLAPLERLALWVDSKQLGQMWMKIIGFVWNFFIYLIPIYIGGQLLMALVIALMYDVLVWAAMPIQ